MERSGTERNFPLGKFRPRPLRWGIGRVGTILPDEARDSEWVGSAVFNEGQLRGGLVLPPVTADDYPS